MVFDKIVYYAKCPMCGNLTTVFQTHSFYDNFDNYTLSEFREKTKEMLKSGEKKEIRIGNFCMFAYPKEKYGVFIDIIISKEVK